MSFFPTLSRRHRVYALRDFVTDTFELGEGAVVLDVAGGKGDLAWLLRNADGLDAIILDPRIVDHDSMETAVAWLRDHEGERAARAVPGVPSHQPLAALVPSLPAACVPPRHARVHVDDAMVDALRRGGAAFEAWWAAAGARADAEMATPKLHHQPADFGRERARVVSAADAEKSLRAAELVVGFHPDEATEACVDLALLLKIPYLVVPCCVFPSKFPHRRRPNGLPVSSWRDFLDYLKRKDGECQEALLPFQSRSAVGGGGSARNVALYRKS